MSTLRFTEPSNWDAIEIHLRGARYERFAFAFTKTVANDEEHGPVLRVVDVELVADQDVEPDAEGWTISDSALDRIHNRAIRAQQGLVEFHNHSFGRPGFSRTDERSLLPTAEYMLDVLDGRPYGAAVWTESALHAEWFRPSAGGSIERGGFRSITVIGSHLQLLNVIEAAPEARFDRQIPILGEGGQAIVRNMRVAIVGAGGTGSHAVMLLGYLGFCDFVLLEDDVIEATNLNRVVTAEPADIGSPKAIVARRRLKALDSGCTVRLVPGVSPTGAHPELAEADLIVGCVDNDGPRHRLNEIAIDSGVPYIDIGTGVDQDVTPPRTGARISFMLPGTPCLMCTEELSATEVGRWYKPPDQKELDRAHGYGLDGPSPAVVHLNGLAVNVAIVEVVAWITGGRPPAGRIDVDLNGDRALPGVRVAPSTEAGRRSGCVDCAWAYRPSTA